jgi:hypothetical protein
MSFQVDGQCRQVSRGSETGEVASVQGKFPPSGPKSSLIERDGRDRYIHKPAEKTRLGEKWQRPLAFGLLMSFMASNGIAVPVQASMVNQINFMRGVASSILRERHSIEFMGSEKESIHVLSQVA